MAKPCGGEPNPTLVQPPLQLTDGQELSKAFCVVPSKVSLLNHILGNPFSKLLFYFAISECYRIFRYNVMPYLSEWLFLIALTVLMATLSYFLDWLISNFLHGKGPHATPLSYLMPRPYPTSCHVPLLPHAPPLSYLMPRPSPT